MIEICVYECNKNFILFIINDVFVLCFLFYIISGCYFGLFLI